MAGPKESRSLAQAVKEIVMKAVRYRPSAGTFVLPQATQRGDDDPGTFGGNIEQDLWETIDSDTGSVAADSPTDTLTLAGGLAIATSVSGDTVTFDILPAAVDHNLLLNLAAGDVHPHYTLLAGRSGGQILTGGTDATDILRLRSTTHATRGQVHIGQQTSGANGIIILNADGTLSIHNPDGTLSVTIGANILDTVFNEAGDDVDFRIEGDTAVNLLKLDAGLDAVQIGASSAGTIADFRAGVIVFNEDGADQDFRVESDNLSEMLFVNAGSDKLYLGTSGVATVADGRVVMLQNSTTAAIAVLGLEQLDVDQPFMDFRGTSAADFTKSISTVAGNAAVVLAPFGPSLPGESGYVYAGMTQDNVNGAKVWRPYYTELTLP